MMTPPSFAEIIVEGPEAQTFLHGQLAADVKAIAPAHWGYACYCVPDGRVQALMMVAHASAEQWRLLLPAELADGVLSRLQRYRLRSRCSLASSEVAIVATVDPLAAAYRCAAFSWSVEAGAASALAPNLWSQQAELGIPWIVAASSELFLPQMLALERLQAYSLRKGCFPGQEVVARIHYLGRSKRRLTRLSQVDGELSVRAGDELGLVGHAQKLGTLVLIDPSSRTALAVLMEAAVAGMRLTVSTQERHADFVIEGDVSETISETMLNKSYVPQMAHGV